MRWREGWAARTLALVATGLAGLGLAACGGDDSKGSTASADAKTGARGGVPIECVDGKIKIGVAKAQSGVASFFDIAGTRGLEIAVEQINARGGLKGCPLEIRSVDTKSDPAVGAQVARSLIDDGAQILVVADDFDTGIAAARVGQQAGVLTLSTAGSSTEFGKAVGDLFFNGGITTVELGKAQARYALDEGWRRTFQVLDTGLAYFTEQDKYYRELYEGEGGSIIEVDKVDSLGGQSDYSSTISKIRKARPDVIQALMVFPGIGTFVKQLRSAGVDTPVIGPLTLQTQELPKLLGRADANNIRFAAQVFWEAAGQDDRTDPQIVQFTRDYERKFGQFPEQANAPGSYQMFMAVNEALQRDDVTDAASAAEAIRAQRNVRVPGGVLAKWEDGHAIWNPVIDGLDQGRFSQLRMYDPAQLGGVG